MHEQISVPADEYKALWSGCGLVALSGWSSVSVTGTDRQAFLQNFCTNDVKRLVPGTSCEAFVTNVKGKIVGHVVIARRAEELVIVTVPEQAGPLIEHLDRYVIREDVQLRDTTAERAFLLVAGDKDKCFNAVMSQLDYTSARNEPFGRLNEFSGRVNDVPVYVMRWYSLREWFTMLFEVSPEELPRLRESLAASSVIVCSQSAFEARHIEAGLPLFGVDFNGMNLPQEVGRDAEAISFTKGCYLGQETVARIDALGHVNQRIAGVRFAGDVVPDNGTELTRDGTKAGRVSSATFSPRLGAPLALAMVRKEANSPGTRLESAYGECEVVSLPLGA